MDSHYCKDILSNGLTLLTIPMPSVQSVTAFLMVRVGSRQEERAYRGISHFLEHMPFKGTRKYPTALKLASTIDGIGAEFNAFTAKEYTGFYVKAAAQHLPLVLDVLSQLVFYPLFNPVELAREKDVIIEEINMYEDQPMTKVGLDFETLLYGDTALGWETIGTKETVSSLKREDFISYMKQWYQPENMVVGIAGAIPQAQNSTHSTSHSTLRDEPSGSDSKSSGLMLSEVEASKLKTQSLVEKYFILARNDLARSKTGFKGLKFKQEKPAIHLRYKKTEQAHFCLGVRAFKRSNEDRYALAVLNTLLGGNMSSRLFTEVREKRGLAYYVRSSNQAYLDNGYLVTQAGTAISKAQEAMRVILEEYNKVQSPKSKVQSHELTKAKEYLKGKLILDLEDSQEVAGLYTEDYLLEEKVRTPDEILQKIDQVNVEDVVRVAAKIFRPENLNLAVIGPFKDGDRRKFESIIQ